MFRFDQVFRDEAQYCLKKVLFQGPEAENDDFELDIEDGMRIQHCEDTQLIVILSRTVYLNEAKNIKVSVSYEADFNTREGMHIPDDVNEKEVLDAFIEEKSAFICMIFSRCALIIAQLTSAVGQPPIITPGVYIEA